ncbi:ABC transporter permease [Propylenella binzhouense]|uniref:ABC transporter permease n=1 Tax=Propylenella binzhouense TaxID=2555902 RepID=A0A964T3S2_9HYPH|nr:ABC transporter permease [Propylenella binzhouense]MYZ47966.1 ABC transporter permease [Propylenella binzhouense]
MSTGLLPEYERFSPRRVAAMVMRYWYLLRSSWPRILDLVYWPAVQMLTWGFLQLYLKDVSSPAGRAGGALIGSVLLWDVLFRGQIGFSMSFLEEMWSRNLGNLLMTPLRPGELILAQMVMSIVRVSIGMLPVSILAMVFFGFNIWALGFMVALFFANLLLTSWTVGLLACGMVLRKGLGAEGLAWSIGFLLLPLCAVYYPVSTYPEWLRWVALALPPTHVFEGLRAAIFDHAFDGRAMLLAAGLNAFYFAIAAGAFVLLLRSARRSGSLLQTGE